MKPTTQLLTLLVLALIATPLLAAEAAEIKEEAKQAGHHATLYTDEIERATATGTNPIYIRDNLDLINSQLRIRDADINTVFRVNS